VSGALDTLAAIDARLPAGVVGLFTTRQGGVSAAPWDGLNLANHVGDDPVAVAANRRRLADHLGVAGLVTVDQTHGRDVVVVDADIPAQAVPADAMVCAQPGVALTVLVADCLPLLLADPLHGVIGAAHAGRAGLVAGVLSMTVAAMIDLGASPADIVAVIGPGVCGRCYEVPAEMRESVARSVPDVAALTRKAMPALDLTAGAVSLLAGLGVGQIRRTDVCTAEDQRFYSYRRDGVTGRFGGVVMLESVDG
jgi:YfiH family protein